MELPNFEKGREYLLQTLALMKDDEDFRKKYASLPETISNRRETSVSLLCDMLARMKRESDAKKQCLDLLDNAADGWRLMLEDRQKLLETIATLKTERDSLLKKVKKFEEEDQERQDAWMNEPQEDFIKREERTRPRKESTSLSTMSTKTYDIFNKSQGASRTVSSSSVPDTHTLRKGKTSSETQSRKNTNPDDRFGDYEIYDVTDSSDETFGDSSRFDTSRASRSDFYRNESLNESNYDDGMSSQFNMPNQSTSTTHGTAGTANPYDHLDSTYYNPTQFYHRLSTTLKKTRKRGGRGSRGGGRGRKSNATETYAPASTSTAPETQIESTRGGMGKPRAPRKKRTTKLTDDSAGSDFLTEADVEVRSPGSRENEESQGNRYSDYTSTFLDETDQSIITSP